MLGNHLKALFLHNRLSKYTCCCLVCEWQSTGFLFGYKISMGLFFQEEETGNCVEEIHSLHQAEQIQFPVMNTSNVSWWKLGGCLVATCN